MAQKKVFIGSVGPFLYDDNNYDGLKTEGAVKADSFSKTSDDAQAEPSNPASGNYVIWLSNGTGAGNNGDLMVKITNTNGTTKTGTLVDFSAI